MNILKDILRVMAILCGYKTHYHVSYLLNESGRLSTGDHSITVRPWINDKSVADIKQGIAKKWAKDPDSAVVVLLSITILM